MIVPIEYGFYWVHNKSAPTTDGWEVAKCTGLLFTRKKGLQAFLWHFPGNEEDYPASYMEKHFDAFERIQRSGATSSQ
jgi:hypothetical protein